MRIISLALRQRIFGSIRKEGNCTIWCGDSTDALIFQGKKHEVYEIAFHLFCKIEGIKEGEIRPCYGSERCISPNHLTLYNTETGRWGPPWKRLEISLEDQVDIVTLYRAGVSKRTLKQWYMLETDELDYVLKNMKDFGKSK